MKYEAWIKCTGMPPTIAMINYIEVVQHLSSRISSGNENMQDDNADIYYDDDDEEDDGEEDESLEQNQVDRVPSLFSGLGHKQSTMQHDEGRFPNVVLNMPEEEEDDIPILVKRAMDALKKDNAESLKNCIVEGLDVHESDDAGQKLLHFAADLGAISCIHTLLQYGADPNASDDEGISVLEAAVINGKVSAVKVLLAAGANPDQQDYDGDSARSYAEKDGSMRMKNLFRI